MREITGKKLERDMFKNYKGEGHIVGLDRKFIFFHLPT